MDDIKYVVLRCIWEQKDSKEQRLSEWNQDSVTSMPVGQRDSVKISAVDEEAI